MTPNRAYLLAFGAGAAIMVTELCSARLLAPLIGSSIHVWAGIIAATLLASSTGAWLAGRTLETQNVPHLAARYLILAAIGLGILPVITPVIALLLLPAKMDHAIQAALITLLGTGLAAGTLGALFPTATKWACDLSGKVGESAGRCSAISTLGSVLGTLATPLFLLPNIPLTYNFLILAGILGTSGLCIRYSTKAAVATSTALLIGTFLQLPQSIFQPEKSKLIRYQESPYQSIRVFASDTSSARTLVLNQQHAGSAYANTKDPEILPYTKFWRLIGTAPESKRALYLGGGAFTSPIAHARNRPQDDITVVEIDPAVTKTATELLGKPPEMKTITGDARRALREIPDRSLDLIFVDAYVAETTIPAHLCTTEFFQEAKTKIKPNGLLILNVVSQTQTDPQKSARAHITTALERNFTFTTTFQCPSHTPGGTKNNFILVATDEENLPPNTDPIAKSFTTWKIPNSTFPGPAPSDQLNKVDSLP